jgi:hypothetical protein
VSAAARAVQHCRAWGRVKLHGLHRSTATWRAVAVADESGIIQEKVDGAERRLQLLVSFRG